MRSLKSQLETLRAERLAEARERESQERALRKVTDELRAMSVKLTDAEGSLEATQRERQTEVTLPYNMYWPCTVQS